MNLSGMLRIAIFPMTSLLLCAQGQDETFGVDVAFGAMGTRFSETEESWKGWLLDVSLGKPGNQWLLAASNHDRPEGKATFFYAGKNFSFGDRFACSLGVGGKQGDDFLPKLRVEGDIQIEIDGGFGFALMGAQSRFVDDLRVQTIQAGPSWSRGRWSLDARYQRLDYKPDAGHDNGYWLDIGREFGERGAWHSLRLAYGHGIMESQQGSLAVMGPTGSRGGASYGGFGAGTGWVHDGSGGSGQGPGGPGGPNGYLGAVRYAEALADADAPLAPLPKERMATLLSNWPITEGFSLRTELSWGDREGADRVLGGSVQIVVRWR